MDTTNSSEKPQRRVKHGQRPTEPLADWPAEFGAAGAEQPAATSGDAPADLQQLKALALAATPGPWLRNRTFGQLSVQDEKYMLGDADAIFIAAANPAVVLGLIARIESAPAPATASGDELPPLPEPVRFAQWTGGVELAYTEDQMRAYARAAVSAATKPTADLSKLTRHGPETTYGFIEQRDDGAYVLLADVQSLLATKPAAATTGWGLAPVEGKKTLEDAARKLVTYSHIYTGDKQASRLAVELSLMAEMMSRSPAASTTGAAQTAEQVRMAEIGQLIATQDNRITDQPIFIVQQRRRITGLDTDYCENIIWLCSEDEYSEASAEDAAQLEADYQETGRARSGWVRTGYMDEWEFVTACFTEQGCKDYLKRDGHNLKEPRIYADGSYRNEEFRAVRNFLMSLRSTPTHSSEAGE